MIAKIIAIMLLAAGAAGAADIQDTWFKDKESRELAEKVMKYRPDLLKTPGRRMSPDGLLSWGIHTAATGSKKDMREAGKIAELLAYKEITEHYNGATIRSHQRFLETFEDDLENPQIKRTFREHTEMVIRGTVYGVEKVAHWRTGNSVVNVYRVKNSK